jgi:hypothetical protein
MPPNLRDPAVFHELRRRWASTDGLVAALLQRHGASCWSQQMTGHGDTVALASGKALYSLHRTDDGLVGAVMLLSSAMGPPMSAHGGSIATVFHDCISAAVVERAPGHSIHRLRVNYRGTVRSIVHVADQPLAPLSYYTLTMSARVTCQVPLNQTLRVSVTLSSDGDGTQSSTAVATLESPEGPDGAWRLVDEADADLRRFPEHWGAPPQRESKDLRPLPGVYGASGAHGSSTMAGWIAARLAEDASAATSLGAAALGAAGAAAGELHPSTAASHEDMAATRLDWLDEAGWMRALQTKLATGELISGHGDIRKMESSLLHGEYEAFPAGKILTECEWLPPAAVFLSAHACRLQTLYCGPNALARAVRSF